MQSRSPDAGHAVLYSAIARLAKEPLKGAPVSQTDETFQGVAYTFYTYGDAPLDLPMTGAELHVRKANHAAWSLILRKGSLWTEVMVADFAPAGGMRALSTETPENPGSLDERLKGTTMQYAIDRGPLAGSVLFIRADETIFVKSHAEAYAPHG